MKKISFLIAAITLMAACSYSQVDPSATKLNNVYTSDAYYLKASKQKTAAWICLGGGLALVATGMIAGAPKAANDYFSVVTLQSSQVHNYSGEAILMVAGGAGMIASIPLFIASAKNKSRARLTMTGQKTPIGLPGNVSRKITSVTLSIPIGR